MSAIAEAKSAIREHESVRAEVTVENTGKRASDEMVQLYLTHEGAGADQPLYSLKACRRIHLQPGASRQVVFDLSPDMVSVINDDGHSVYLKGQLKISIGGSSPGRRKPELGATERKSVG